MSLAHRSLAWAGLLVAILGGVFLAGARCVSRQGRQVMGAPGVSPDARLRRVPSARRVVSPEASAPAGLPDIFPTDPQPLFRGDPARRGRAAQALPRRAPSIRWRAALGGPIPASAALDRRDILYVGTLDGQVHALRASGEPLWRRALGDRIFAAVAVSDRCVIAGSDGDRVHCLDFASGRELWSFGLGPCPRGVGRGPESVRCDADSAAVLAPDGTIYFGGDALYALTPEGRLKWRYPLERHARSSPAIGADGTVYVGFQGGGVLAVTPSGERRWEYRTKFDFDATPAVTEDNTVLIGADDGVLYALDGATGTVRFSVPTRGPVGSSAAVGWDGVITFGSDDGKLYAVRPGGALLWTFATGGPIRSSPVVDRAGTVVVGSQDDHLYALAAGGRELWRLRLGGDVDSSVVVGPGGTLYVGADDGFLYALR